MNSVQIASIILDQKTHTHRHTRIYTHFNEFRYVSICFGQKFYFYEDCACDSWIEVSLWKQLRFRIFDSIFFSEKMWKWLYTKTPKKERKIQIYIRFCSLGLSSTMNKWMNEWYCGYKTSETTNSVFFSNLFYGILFNGLSSLLISKNLCDSMANAHVVCVYMCASVYLIKV